jgi:hypothetical protein
MAKASRTRPQGRPSSRRGAAYLPVPRRQPATQAQRVALEQKEVELLTVRRSRVYPISQRQDSSVTLDNGDCRPADIHAFKHIGNRPTRSSRRSAFALSDGKLIASKVRRTLDHIYAIGDMVWTKTPFDREALYTPRGTKPTRWARSSGQRSPGNRNDLLRAFYRLRNRDVAFSSGRSPERC